MQGRSPGPRSAERGTLLCSHKRRRGSKGEPSPGVPPFIYSWVCACAPMRWAVVATPCCLSTPFLWCLPKETVSSRQRTALFLPWWLHHSRERYCLGRRDVPRPTVWRGWWVSELGACAPVCWVEVSYTYCPFHPISLLLRKETGWSPKETRLRVPPRGLLGPTRLSHGLEAPTSQPTASS